jgi:hypothetical protein
MPDALVLRLLISMSAVEICGVFPNAVAERGVCMLIGRSAECRDRSHVMANSAADEL